MRLLQPGVQQIGIWAVLSLGVPLENDANVNTIWFRVSWSHVPCRPFSGSKPFVPLTIVPPRVSSCVEPKAQR
jgi:hypothetical protein